MRILHVIARLAKADGGPPNGVLNLAKAQAAMGDEVTILPCSTSGGQMLMEPGTYGKLTIYKPPTNGKVIWPNRDIKKLLKSLAENMDIFHIHGTWRYHLIAAGLAAQKIGIPYIIRPAGDKGIIPLKSKRYGKKPYFWLIEKPIFNKAAAIHCCTKKEFHELQDLDISARCFIIPQPIDNSLEKIQADFGSFQHLYLGIKENDIVLLYLGRIGWIKRLPLLVKAFVKINAEFPDSHLILAGPWEEPKIIDEINTIAKQANIEKKLHLPKMVEGCEKASLLKRSTVFVQPSSHENFGISVAEALMFGKACVVSEGVGLAEDILKASAGEVFIGDNEEHLSNLITKIIEDLPYRRKLESNALNMSKNFEPEEVARNLRNEYEVCIKG